MSKRADRPVRRRRGPVGGRVLGVAMTMCWLAAAWAPAYAQQFNSDNYWTAPHGVGTVVATAGQHYSALLDTVALFPSWEFTVGATMFRHDAQANTTDHYSATGYVKYMGYENEAKNGGWAVMAGTGVVPGFFDAGAITNELRSYWVYAPIVTLPFGGGAVSWDLMPGATLNTNQDTNDSEWGFLWSTRMAVYKIIPQSAIVGEVFGTEGDAHSDTQYRLGVRWEGEHVIAAATYGAGLNGSEGAGFEFGIMFLTPPFLCFGGC